MALAAPWRVVVRELSLAESLLRAEAVARAAVSEAAGSELEQILAADPTESRTLQLVQQHVDNARLAQTLVRLRLDIPLGFNLKAIRYSQPTVTPADGRS